MWSMSNVSTEERLIMSAKSLFILSKPQLCFQFLRITYIFDPLIVIKRSRWQTFDPGGMSDESLREAQHIYGVLNY